jgi:hypothetical protein
MNSSTDIIRILTDHGRRARARQESGEPAAEPIGVGAPAGILDPLVDANVQLSSLQAYFATIAAGQTPTSVQLAAAQEALGSLQADLQALQYASDPKSAPGSKMWVSAGAAGAGMAASAVVGGVVGWLVRGESNR